MTDAEYRDRILKLMQEIGAAFECDDARTALLKARELHRHIFHAPPPPVLH
jgi:hypothetical protein